MQEIVEVGILLPQPLEFYHELLQNAGMENVFSCHTHDVYWTQEGLHNKTERQMKDACIRYRSVTQFGFGGNYKPQAMMQNYPMCKPECKGMFFIPADSLDSYDKMLRERGYMRVFDTSKDDHHYATPEMSSRIQLQQIEDIGLVLYYDNPNYYHMQPNEQRKALIDELNSYGFNIPYTQLGVDKLRTLYTGELCYSANQNA